MLWIIGLVFFILFVLLLLYLCFTEEPPGQSNDRPHVDLQEFRNQHRADSPFRSENTNEQHPTVQENDNRTVLVKRNLYSHTLQPGESARNLSAAMLAGESTTTNIIISSSSSRNKQPQCSMFAHWWYGMEASVRSVKESVRSVISNSKPECSICLQQYEEGETISWAKKEECNHMFHEECIVRWLENHDECPLCRINLCLNGDPDE